MYETYDKKYCDNVHGARRVVTVRDSPDGRRWSQDWGCLDKPQKDEHCTKFNTTAMVRPNDAPRQAQGRAPDEDPPELEFYRIRPFVLPGTDRLAAHVLLYVPAPSAVVLSPGYGRQPLWYCKQGCCHGPHMYEEWWVGPTSGDPTDLPGWRRPFFDTRAFPHDIWALAQPVQLGDQWVWVGSGRVWGLPAHRLAGLGSVSNAEFSTAEFTMPKGQLWLDADASWGETPEWCPGGCNGVGGADEGRQAYIMASLLDAQTGKVLDGYEPERCIVTNTTGSRIPLQWANATGAVPVGKRVRARFYLRDATIWALGAGL